MRHPILTAMLLAALALPLAAFAQEADAEDAKVDSMVEMMKNAEGLPQANLGEKDNGWFFVRKDGVCRMFSFNDPLTIQADPSDPLGTQFQFLMIDSVIPEAQGAQIPMVIAIRGKDGDEFNFFNAVVIASRNSYVMPVPLGELVTHYPNGFQLVLLDKDQKRIMQSDTLGSAKHLAALAACSKGS
ncbi:hypothetical protein [Lysobacter sp. P5_B9]